MVKKTKKLELNNCLCTTSQLESYSRTGERHVEEESARVYDA